jgi:metallo-beta-lactamase family protein
MKVHVLGAAQTVTGSQYLLEGNDGHYLVDCGLFQGDKELLKRNERKFSYDPSKIKAVFLTHSHIDHSGLLPRLVAEGFSGDIYCSLATARLLPILLLDSAAIQHEEVRKEKKKNKKSKKKPLYTTNDVKRTLNLLKEIPFHKTVSFGHGQFQFLRAGHILGAASLQINIESREILFSGDLGRSDDYLMLPPEVAPQVDHIFLESTYGDRLHPKEQILPLLKRLVIEAKENQSVLLIPAFALGRMQLMINLFYQLFEKEKDLEMPIYINSPMSMQITEVYKEFSKETKHSGPLLKRILNWPKWIEFPRQSKQLNEKTGPMIIMASSGMMTGGRILHHLKAFAEDPKTRLLLVGYQAEGTLGRKIVEGMRSIELEGKELKINCKVEKLDHLSAHADQKQLCQWVDTIRSNTNISLTHGEIKAQEKLKSELEKVGLLNLSIPELGDVINI